MTLAKGNYLMTVLKNNHSAALGLPNGTVVQPGASVKVDDFNKVKDHPVVASWLEVGALEEVSEREASSEEARTSRKAARTPAAKAAQKAAEADPDKTEEESRNDFEDINPGDEAK